MPIIGNIIKGFIDVRDKLADDHNPVEAQKEVLKRLLETAKDTAFGRHYQFDEILVSQNLSASFAASIPYHDYNKMDQEWWQKIHEGKENVTWPGRPDYFALSSGTTGTTSKRIPVTDAMISSIRDAGIQQVYALSNFDMPSDFFEKAILMLGSSTELEEVEGHEEGEISGISASNIPTWFRGYYKPGKEISAMDDWDEKVQKIAEEAPTWDIGGLSGIPSWIELMLQKVIDHNNLNHIHEIWPNLQVYTSGGVAFGPYEKSFKALLGKPVTIIDTYLASEGFIAFQARPDTEAMQLVTDGGIYFEFVPFDPDYIAPDGSLTDEAPSLTLSEVEADQDYVLIISTVSGAWRYLIGDTIAFTDIAKAEIIITGRTKFFLNTVGSQLSVNKLNDAVQYLEEQFSIKLPEYTLCAHRIEGEFYHCWYLGTENQMNGTELADALDDYLKSANNNYRVARSKALKGVKVTLADPQVFYDWNGRNKKKGGQVKMERVMGEDTFSEWEGFVKSSQ